MGRVSVVRWWARAGVTAESIVHHKPVHNEIRYTICSVTHLLEN